MFSPIIYSAISIIISFMLFVIILYYQKPSFICDKQPVISKRKIVTNSLLLAICVGLLVFLLAPSKKYGFQPTLQF